MITISAPVSSEEFRSMCNRCCRPTKACFCDEITPFSTTFEFRILMHPKEAKYSHVGTGRIANVALTNCKIIIGECFDDNQEVQKLINSKEYFPLMLYPGDTSFNISKESFAPDYFQNRIPLIFILDGTWSCAKTMIRDSKSLHDLPKISFDSSIESNYSIRHQPAKYCLSTIESIYQVLFNLERLGLEKLGEKKEVLLQALAKLVEFQKRCADDPTLRTYRHEHSSYKESGIRKPSKKWQVRKICFEGREKQKILGKNEK